MAILADLGLQHHCPLNAGLARQRRIARLYLANEQPLGDALRYAHTLRSRDLGTATGVELMMPPMTPPIWPPGTPPERRPQPRHRGDRRRSFLFLDHLNFLGNLRGGAQLAVDDIGLDLLTTLTGVAAGGGGGGGGGGGATRNVISWFLGRASVNKRDKTKTPISTAWKINDEAVVHPRLVLSLLPDSIRLSSNIRFSPARTLRTLRHRLSTFCSRYLRHLHFCLLQQLALPTWPG